LALEPLEDRTLLSTYVRKNEDTLSSKEIKAFVDAIKTLKTTYNDGSTVSVYDSFVQEHADAFANGQAHGGPAFLAWHREFLLQFEQALQTVDSSVTIPYWDFTVDNSTSSSLWSDDFLGGNGDPTDNNIVTTGPFRQGEWTLNVNGDDGTSLRRDFGGLVSTLPTADDVTAAENASSYDVFPFDTGSPIDQSFRNNLEGFNHSSGEPELHNRVHAWIGGSMAIQYSPNDPVFWMLHANLDRLWAEWQDQNSPGYAPESGAADGQNLTDLMSPFNVTPQSVLDHRALGYRYDTESDGGNGPSGAALPARVGTPTELRRVPTPSATLVQPFLHGLHGFAPGDFDSFVDLTRSLGMVGEQGNQPSTGGMAAAFRNSAHSERMGSEAAGVSFASTGGMERRHV
jgi:tyrosinase